MKRGTLIVLLAAAVVVLGLAVTGTAAPRPMPGKAIVTGLEVEQWQFGANDEVTITWTLTNQGTAPVRILRWQTPIDGIEHNILQVERDGAPVTYTGRMYKRATPQPEDYIEVKPGETISAVFDPSAAYDMTATGAYTIRYRTALQGARVLQPEGGVQAEDAEGASSVESNLVVLRIEGRAQAEPLVIETEAQGAEIQAIAYKSCTTSRQSTLVTAHANATTIATKARTHLTSYPSGSTLQTRWFGVFNTTRYNTVKTHFVNEVTAFTTKTVTYNCSCNQNAYAYVYPNKPYEIYLCKAFWTAPAMGRDSKAGTLVHEMSHFYVVGSTQDYVYGETGALSLARTDPAKAVMNADNHEYFAEDQP